VERLRIDVDHARDSACDLSATWFATLRVWSAETCGHDAEQSRLRVSARERKI
jgi:hypothetical protein